MKPGKYDRKHAVRISGAELRELKRLDMPESLGLDRRIARYQGTRPMGLYRWDFEYLLDTLSLVVDGRDPFVSLKGRKTLTTLHNRLRAIYDATYRAEDEEIEHANAGPASGGSRQPRPVSLMPVEQTHPRRAGRGN
jgi:hypothetical protein